MDAFNARDRIQWLQRKDAFLQKGANSQEPGASSQDLEGSQKSEPKSKKAMLSMSLLILALLILPCYVFLQTRLHVLDVSLEKQRNLYEEAYEENRLLKDDMRNFSSEVLQNFSELGLKKIFAKDIPIVEFQKSLNSP